MAEEDSDVERVLRNASHWKALTEIYPNLLPRFDKAISQRHPEIAAALAALASKRAHEFDPFQGHFAFTPMEDRLARHLMGGGSTKDYAAAHGLSANTVRNQLQAIYEKTGVNRQAALVSLLYEAAGRPPSGAG